MSRVVEIRDSRTLIVETNGVIATVSLRGVLIRGEDEAAASAYLRRTLAKTWVYIEDGEIYRSPDGLHVNDAMRRRAWLGMTYLGELHLGLRNESAVRKKKSSPAKRPVERRRPRRR